MYLVTEAAQQNGNDQRTTGQTQFHRHAHARYGDRNTTQNDTEEDTHEEGYHVGLVQTFGRVAQLFGQTVDVFDTAYYGEAVADLQLQIGVGQQV